MGIHGLVTREESQNGRQCAAVHARGRFASCYRVGQGAVSITGLPQWQARGTACHTDAETVWECYTQSPRHLLGHITGSFALAVWDDARQELFCARDHCGQEPFYYAHGDKGEFLFSSDITTLVASNLFTPTISLPALSHYLKRLSVPVNETIYKNVFVLPPAHFLVYSQGRLSIARYWELPPPDYSLGFEESVARFKELFSQALARQYSGKTSVSSLLSGGLDSSSVVAELARADLRIKTFTLGFAHGKDERPLARLVADAYKTDHFTFEDTEIDLPESLRKMAHIYEEPFANAVCIPTVFLYEKIAEHDTIAFSGDGSDELLGGYYKEYTALLYMLQSKKHFLRNRLGRFMLKAAKGLKLLEFSPRQKAYFDGVAFAKRYTSIAEARNNTLYLEFFKNKDIASFGLPPAPGLYIPPLYGDIDDILRIDVCNYFVRDGLTNSGKAANHAGIKMYSPFLERDLFSFLVRVPWQFKITTRQTKILLREAYAERWPHAVRTAPKTGFWGTPIPWLASPGMQDAQATYFAPQRRIHSYIPTETIRHHHANPSPLTWILLQLSVWLEEVCP